MEANHINSLSAQVMLAQTYKQLLAIGIESGYEMKDLSEAGGSYPAVAAPKAEPQKKE